MGRSVSVFSLLFDWNQNKVLHLKCLLRFQLMTARRMWQRVRLAAASHAPTCGNMWMYVCVCLGAQTNPTRLNIYKNLNKSVSTCRAGAYWVKGLHTQGPPVSAVINRLQLILAVNDRRVWVVGKERHTHCYLIPSRIKNSWNSQHPLSVNFVFVAGILQHPDGTVLKQLQPPPRGPRELQFYSMVISSVSE